MAGRLLEFYPDLPHRHEKHRLSTQLTAYGLLATAPYRLATHQIRLLVRHDAMRCLSRLARRPRIAAR